MSLTDAGACPSGWESFGSSCYFFATDPEMTQNDAYKDCKSRNKVEIDFKFYLCNCSTLIIDRTYGIDIT